MTRCLPLVLLALAGCAPKVYHPVASSPFDKARYDCELAWNQSTGSYAARDQLLSDCMKAHGYSSN